MASEPKTLIPQKSLNELLEHQSALLRQIVDHEGEITEELEPLLAEVSAALLQKVDAYKFLLDRLEAEENFFKQRADFFSRTTKKVKAVRENLKDRLKFALRELPSHELKGEEHRFLLAPGKAKVVLAEGKKAESLLGTEHERFVRKKEIYEFDKTAIAEALESGEELPFASLAEGWTLRDYANTGVERRKKHELQKGHKRTAKT